MSDLSQLPMLRILTTYRKPIWNAFTRAIRTYQLIQPNDCIAVCISGGKDSMLLAKCMQQFQKYGEIPFSLQFLAMDPGYCPENRARLEQNAALLQIPVTIFQTNVFEVVRNHAKKNPCFLCSKIRRGQLYEKAHALGCNKIALGHHFDDVIETILMGMLYGGQLQTMLPKLKSANFPDMQLIRPLYFVREAVIQSWVQENQLQFLQCACEATQHMHFVSKRQEIKQLIQQLKQQNPDVEHHIFRSVDNVDIHRLLSYHDGDTYHHSWEI